MNEILKTQTLKADIMAIDHKISMVDAAINKAKNVKRFAEVCSKITKSEHYRAIYHNNAEIAQAEITEQEKQRAVFQKGYDLILNKY